ncbi:cell wall hydrolase [Caulobacter segnis]|nr:cell wall hydrolase [Caulobacter segnis]
MAATARGLSDRAFGRLTADMDDAALAVARRHDPVPRLDYWGRVPGWERLDLKTLPTLALTTIDFDTARKINAFKAAAPLPPAPARPFVLKAGGAERDRALQCLSQAVYFEAAYEPLEGQQAVAQTVLNRMRHPGYPKSVCGVVFEGSQRTTGCQFSFTCDGSLARPLNPAIYAQAQAVARRALNGFVLKSVGTATHYHADYVAPYWAPTLVKLRQIGAHIFYRWTGPSGEPAAFTGRYAGGELKLDPAVLTGFDARIQNPTPGSMVVDGKAVGTKVVTIPGPTGRIEVVQVPDAAAPDGMRTRVRTTLAGRRQATPEEMEQINARLKALEERMRPSAEADPGAPISTAPPKPQ